MKDDQSSKLDQVATWVAEQREEAGLSLQELAFRLRELRFHVSPNKLWRLEQGSKQIKKLDGELLMWIERVFETQCPHLRGASPTIDQGSLIKWLADLHKKFDLSGCIPDDPMLEEAWREATT